MDLSRYEFTKDRLFVPLNTGPFRWFESGEKEAELRGINDRFNTDTVKPGRIVELRRGYSTGDSIWGVIDTTTTYSDLESIQCHEKIAPGKTREEFLESAEELVGGYDRYILFRVAYMVDDELERIRKRLFLNEYDPRTGEYRGEDPPKKGDVLKLDESDDYWCDEWIDKTGDFKKKQKELIKGTDCECGEFAWGGPRARFVRCSNCSRVMIDRGWEDDRFKDEKDDDSNDSGVMGLDRFK